MPGVSMRQMLEAGVHFGHQTRFWNPKMAPFIFGERNKIHIINLEKTQPLYVEASAFIKGVVADGGTVLFVGTKRSARDAVQKEASAQRHALRQPALAGRHAHQFQDHPPVDQAPGARSPSWPTTGALDKRGKKEATQLRREMDKLERSLGGIKDMESLPGCAVRDRRRSREDRDPRGQEARHPGGGGRRHQLLARMASTT